MFTRRELERALSDQGFTLISTNHGVRVLAPDGVSTANYHPSIFDKQSERRAYQNLLSALKKIGFDVQEATTPKAQKREKGLTLLGPVEKERPMPEPEVARLDSQPEGPDTRTRLAAQLGDLGKEAYDLIVANPGAHLSDLIPKMTNVRTKTAASQRIRTLVERGLVRRTGKTNAVQFWPTEGELPPSPGHGWPKEKKAGPVRVRHIEPADPVVAYRRKATRAQQLSQELRDLHQELEQAYQEQHEELTMLRRKVDRLSKALGNAVDQL